VNDATNRDETRNETRPEDCESPEGVTVSYREKTSPVWDMSQERALIEGIMNQRFNFFLVFFSLVVAGALNAKSALHLRVVLALGTCVASLLAYSIIRAHRKLGTILRYLFQDPTHPATRVDRVHRSWLSVRWVTGWAIPALCTAALATGLIASVAGALVPPTAENTALLQDLQRRVSLLEGRTLHRTP
jgi:hypothetical protein